MGLQLRGMNFRISLTLSQIIQAIAICAFTILVCIFFMFVVYNDNTTVIIIDFPEYTWGLGSVVPTELFAVYAMIAGWFFIPLSLVVFNCLMYSSMHAIAMENELYEGERSRHETLV